jgi:hypothetical protein
VIKAGRAAWIIELGHRPAQIRQEGFSGMFFRKDHARPPHLHHPIPKCRLICGRVMRVAPFPPRGHHGDPSVTVAEAGLFQPALLNRLSEHREGLSREMPNRGFEAIAAFIPAVGFSGLSWMAATPGQFILARCAQFGWSS